MSTITSVDWPAVENARLRARQEGELEKRILKYIEEYKRVVEAVNTEQINHSDRWKCEVTADIMVYTLRAFYHSGVWLPDLSSQNSAPGA